MNAPTWNVCPSDDLGEPETGGYRYENTAVHAWTAKQVIQWLFDNELPMYGDSFGSMGVVGATLLEMDRDPGVMARYVTIGAHKAKLRSALHLAQSARLPSPLQLPQHSPSVSTSCSSYVITPPATASSQGTDSPDTCVSGRRGGQFPYSKRGRLLRRATTGDSSTVSSRRTHAVLPSAPSRPSAAQFTQELSGSRSQRASSLPGYSAVGSAAAGKGRVPRCEEGPGTWDQRCEGPWQPQGTQCEGASLPPLAAAKPVPPRPARCCCANAGAGPARKGRSSSVGGVTKAEARQTRRQTWSGRRSEQLGTGSAWHLEEQVLEMTVSEFLHRVLKQLTATDAVSAQSRHSKQSYSQWQGMVETCNKNFLREGYLTVHDLVADVHFHDFRDDLRGYGMKKRYLNQFDSLLLDIRSALDQGKLHTSRMNETHSVCASAPSPNSRTDSGYVTDGELDSSQHENDLLILRKMKLKHKNQKKSNPRGSSAVKRTQRDLDGLSVRCDYPTPSSWSDRAAAAASALASVPNSATSTAGFAQTLNTAKAKYNRQDGPETNSECEEVLTDDSVQTDAAVTEGGRHSHGREHLEGFDHLKENHDGKFNQSNWGGEALKDQQTNIRLDAGQPTTNYRRTERSVEKGNTGSYVRSSQRTTQPKYKRFAPQVVSVGHSSSENEMALGINMQAVEDEEDFQRSYQFNDDGLLQYGDFVVGPRGIEYEPSKKVGQGTEVFCKKTSPISKQPSENQIFQDGSRQLRYQRSQSSSPSTLRRQKCCGDGSTELQHVLCVPNSNTLPRLEYRRPPPSHLQLKDRIHLIRQVGKGAGGVVFKSLDMRGFQVVAVKQVLVHDSDQRHQMKRELNALLCISHPNIVRFIDSFTSPREGTLSMVFEFVALGSLQDVLDRGKPMPLELLGTVTLQCLRGVEYLHNRNLVHRDIKPSNLLVSRNGQLKVADFGISRDLEGTQAMASTYLGTMMYMSPERVKGEDYSFNCDIWSLGLSLLGCALGRFPFSCNGGWWSLAQAIQRQAIPRAQHAHHENQLVLLVESMLCRDPATRPLPSQLLGTEVMAKFDGKSNLPLAEWVGDLERPPIAEGAPHNRNCRAVTPRIDDVGSVAKALFKFFGENNQIEHDSNSSSSFVIVLQEEQQQSLQALSTELGVNFEHLMSTVVRKGEVELGKLSPASA